MTPESVVWTYSGVRPLYDDGASKAQEATRDYVLTLDAPEGEAPLLSVFGGKITTYRRLAEGALAKLGPFFPKAGGPWTAGVPFPGGDFPVDGVEALEAEVRPEHMTVKHTRNVRKCTPKARWMYSGAPPALGYFVTSSR